MATIAIYTSGTLGDHLPYFALGQALTARGHDVRMVINQAMHAYARRAGLAASALTDIDRGPEQARANARAWDHWNHAGIGGDPNARPLDRGHFLVQARELIELCRGADLLIAMSIRALGYVAHAALGLPWLTASMNPFTFWQATSAEERQAQDESWVRYHAVFRPLLEHTFTELGIARELPPCAKGWLFAPHVLLASSSHFSRPDLGQLQPRSSIDMTGFWWYDDPVWRDWQPDEELRRFCERRPMVLTFSSQPLEDPRRILALHVEAAARLGRPLLIQRGWASFSEEDLSPAGNRQDILFADSLPHDWLFARASCAIQHGGIGSIARALQQGCPLLIEPFGNDQLYNASRVVNLGVGAAMHPFKSTVDGFVQALGRDVLTAECRQRAEALGARMRTDDGIGTACRLIEAYLARVQAGGDDSRPLLTNPHAPYLDEADLPTPAQSHLPIRPRNGAAIPHIIHQSWKDAALPPDLAQFQQTWQAQHPGWTYYLWTDADNREFIRRHYPWFLPIFDGYPEPIMRADAVRYFILHHYGGVYADLDAECLRPLDPLLEDRTAVFALEPEHHVDDHRKGGYPFDYIVGNAVMASMPGHLFWDEVFKQLIAYHHAPGALDATGPHLLTRAYEGYATKDAVYVAPSDVFYPITSATDWRVLKADERARVAQVAYTVHHWHGGWWRVGAARQTEQVKATLAAMGGTVSVASWRVDMSLSLLRAAIAAPRVSCLMVTRNRTTLAQRSVRCFQQQTYDHKELVIVDDGEADTLEMWVKGLTDEQIVFVRLPDEGKTLGELRNIAVDRATGTYLAQWDDDDLSDPGRLEIQMAAIYTLKTDACFLERQYLWWPEERRLAVSCRRTWEGSFACARDKFPAYPLLVRGEDTPVIDEIAASCRVAVLDFPLLYVYVFHGANTFGAEHWEKHWESATARYEGALYDVMIQELARNLSLDLSPWTGPSAATPLPVDNEVARHAQGVGQTESHPAPVDLSATPQSVAAQVYAPAARAAPRARMDWPRVLILAPVKDAARYLPRFWSNVQALTYPHDRISLAFLESDSAEGTYAAIEAALPTLRAEFAGVQLYKQDYGYRFTGPRWEASEQLRRRSILAKSRNTLLSRALTDEEWVLWIDVDVASWPDDVIERLLAVEKDILAPNCLSEKTRDTFDRNTFKLKPGADKLDWSRYILNGILVPPFGYGRFYLSDLRQHDCVEIDGVGGTMLLIRADLHREGLVFPTFPYRYHIETEGLALMARDMGYRCWGLPNLEIYHP